MTIRVGRLRLSLVSPYPEWPYPEWPTEQSVGFWQSASPALRRLDRKPTGERR